MSVVMTSFSNWFLNWTSSSRKYNFCVEIIKISIFFIIHIRPNLRSNFYNHKRLERFQRILCISRLCGSRVGCIEILTMMPKMPILSLIRILDICICLLFMQINYKQWLFGIHTQFGLSSKYSCQENCTILNFINVIGKRASFAVRGPTFLITLCTIVMVT